MESNLAKLKTFNCPNHPEEVIQRVSLNPQSAKNLFCLECIMELEKSEKNLLIDYKSLLKSLFQNLTQISSCVIESPPPSSLTTLLDNRDAYIAKMTEHIMSQKLKVCNSIKAFQDEVNSKIDEVKDKILVELDTQVAIFKKNFDSYEDMIKKTFSSHEQQLESSKLTEECLASDLNSSRTTIDFASKMKSILLDIEENKALMSLDKNDQEIALLKSLKSYSEKIEKSVEAFVTSNAVSANSEVIKSKNQFQKSFEDFLNYLQILQNPVGFLKQEFPSQILPTSEMTFIEKVVNQGKIKLKSIYYGSESKNKINISTIRDLWRTKGHLLCLVKKTNGAIVGVYKEAAKDHGTVTTFDLLKKFHFKCSFNVMDSSPSCFQLSQALDINQPPIRSYDYIASYMDDHPQKYDHGSDDDGSDGYNAEDYEEEFQMDSVEVLEVEYNGKKPEDSKQEGNLKLNQSIFGNMQTQPAFHADILANNLLMTNSPTQPGLTNKFTQKKGLFG